MKVAVFGCLHGMLDEMYSSIQRYEAEHNINIDLVLVCGDCQTIRHFDDLKCLSVPAKYKKLGDFHDYYSGKKSIPKLTIFVGGNHEASNYLMTLPYGGWVCDNFYYIGYAGVIRYRGLRIAGISGIYNSNNCNRGRFERLPLDDRTIRSCYHTRNLDVFKLKLLSRRAEIEDPLDVFLSHDWPLRIYDHGNKQQLLRFKPLFRRDIESREGLGSPLTQPLIKLLRPKRWFAAHLHCRFYAKVEHEAGGSSTEFLSLNKIENRRNFMEIVDLIPRPDQSDLQHDAEWLTILRKTVSLDNDSKDNVFCPNSDEPYLPTDDEIKETVKLMGDLTIKKNFRMVEPVIYNRPGSVQPSLDQDRQRNYSNHQTEELVERLQLHNYPIHKIKKQKKEELNEHENIEQRKEELNEHLNIKPKKEELDDDGCLPFYVDTAGDK